MTLSYPSPTLADEVVRLRAWDEGDLACIRQAGSDPRIPAGTSVPAVFSKAEGLAFIHRQEQRLIDGEGVSLAITDATTDIALGLVWLPVRPQPRVMGLGYWLVPDARGRGFATRAAALASDWALSVAGARRVEAWVEVDNAPSLKVLAAAGFVREGILRAFLALGEDQVDIVVLSRTRAAPDT